MMNLCNFSLNLRRKIQVPAADSFNQNTHGTRTDIRTGAIHYEPQRKRAGVHLLFDTFWLIPHFFVNLIDLSNPMHQIDNGVNLTFLKVILRIPEVCRFIAECVESVLGRAGLAVESSQQAAFEKITAGCFLETTSATDHKNKIQYYSAYLE